MRQDPPHRGDSAAFSQCHHGSHQGQHAQPHCLPGANQDRWSHHPGQNGAEALLGKGMLFLPPGVASLERLHGAFVSDDEVNGVTDFVREQASPVYEAQISADEVGGGPSMRMSTTNLR